MFGILTNSICLQSFSDSTMWLEEDILSSYVTVVLVTFWGHFSLLVQHMPLWVHSIFTKQIIHAYKSVMRINSDVLQLYCSKEATIKCQLRWQNRRHAEKSLCIISHSKNWNYEFQLDHNRDRLSICGPLMIKGKGILLEKLF